MKRQIYVNLPVKNLPASQQFFLSLGFEFHPAFTNETSAGLIVGENIYVMLLTEEFFGTFTPNSVCDAKRSTEVLVCISCASREEVDALVRKATHAGGRTFRKPQEHDGMMYGHSFQDLDGHIWELIHTSVPSAAS